MTPSPRPLAYVAPVEVAPTFPEPEPVTIYNLPDALSGSDLPENTTGQECVLVSDGAGALRWVEKFDFMNNV